MTTSQHVVDGKFDYQRAAIGWLSADECVCFGGKCQTHLVYLPDVGSSFHTCRHRERERGITPYAPTCVVFAYVNRLDRTVRMSE